jgi:hypothetical protein
VETPTASASSAILYQVSFLPDSHRCIMREMTSGARPQPLIGAGAAARTGARI